MVRGGGAPWRWQRALPARGRHASSIDGTPQREIARAVDRVVCEAGGGGEYAARGASAGRCPSAPCIARYGSKTYGAAAAAAESVETIAFIDAGDVCGMSIAAPSRLCVRRDMRAR